MTRRLGVLLAAILLVACTSPFEPQRPLATPTALPLAATIAPSPTQATLLPTDQAVAPTPSTLPEPAEALDDPAQIAAAVPAERDQAQLVEAFKNTGPIPRVARTTPLDVHVGDVQPFWVANVLDNSNYLVTSTLRYAGPVVLMYVDNELDVSQSDIERSAKLFEEQIYPRDRELFGTELSPGIDGDPRLTVLNTALSGAGGYFSSADGVVKAVNRFSNEREMFVIGVNSYPLGSKGYASTLAHEFQHMIEWNQQRRSPSWFNEGMSTVAEDLNGYVTQSTANLYLSDPDVQLTAWSSTAAQTGEHYGTSQLFLRYFQEQYAGENGLAELLKADAGNNLDAFAPIAARKRSDITSFADIYADWAVANILDNPTIADGRYSYKLLPGSAALSSVQAGEVITTVNQFGVDYLGLLKGPLTLRFAGDETVGLTGALPKDGHAMWWSNRGDDSVQTLTRAFDLSSVQHATLQFSTWYELERNWDYGFVTVSTDAGKSWTTLRGTTTTTDDPQGQNLGNGITGVSGVPQIEPDKGTRAKWVEEQMDLTPFAGKRILLRFWVVNDAGYNASGLLLDRIRIPELSYQDNVEDGDGGWQAQGFVQTTGELVQQWTLRLIHRTGATIQVDPLPVDSQGHSTLKLADGDAAILAVMATTRFTTQPGTYTYTVTAP